MLQAGLPFDYYSRANAAGEQARLAMGGLAAAHQIQDKMLTDRLRLGLDAGRLGLESRRLDLESRRLDINEDGQTLSSSQQAEGYLNQAAATVQIISAFSELFKK